MAARRRANSMTDALGMRREYQDLLQNQPGFAEAIADTLANATTHEEPNRLKIEEFLATLPKVTEQDLAALDLSGICTLVSEQTQIRTYLRALTDASCPICITPFLALLAEEEMAVAMDSPARPLEELGITKLKDKCNHVFCKKDIQNWLRGGHNSCPTCRHVLVDIPVQTSPTDQTLTVAQMIAMLGREDPSRPAAGARDLFEILDAAWAASPIARPSETQRRNNGDDHDGGSRQEYNSMYS
ncbi:hypothetical protein QCA50_006730 [Cerrena zonata]|uniref:RING-type domain-containing protein n=1 Tax=Cerrena zonata TaxID=2478898 RepID=A0AAW0GKB9_9APHY